MQFAKILGNEGHLRGSVKCLTLDFGSGHDLTVCEFKPHVGLFAVSAEPTWDPLSPSLSAPSTQSLPISLKNK